jgi:hypothetical protein
MNDKTKTGLAVLQAALALGIVGDKLLRAWPWGVNVLLWVGALAGLFVWLARRHRARALRMEGAWLFAPILFFAAAFAWRDSATLKFLDVIALMVALALAAWHARGHTVAGGGVMDYATGLATAAFSAAFEALTLVFGDIEWKDIPRSGWTKHALAIARGVLIALPLLLVFGGLFVAADAVFSGIIKNTFNLDIEQLMLHGVFICFLTYVAAGFLRGALLGGSLSFANATQSDLVSGVKPQAAGLGLADAGNAPAAPAKAAWRPSLGVVEIGIVLGLMDLLFLWFVVVQVKYFFGGAALVQATAGLTFAEYARSGFFELVTVAALVLPILLASHWLMRREKDWHGYFFNALAALQIVLLFVIMYSAVSRMRLYQSEYGQTELRLYTTVFMGWLALVFVWFALTVLRGQRQQFACGALALAFTVLAGLHFFNPDAHIVRANIQHAQSGHYFDAGYANGLSADAAPELLAAFPALDAEGRCLVARNLRERWTYGESWLSWNASRSAARGLVNAQAAQFDALNCPKPQPVTHTEEPARPADATSAPAQVRDEPAPPRTETVQPQPKKKPQR